MLMELDIKITNKYEHSQGDKFCPLECSYNEDLDFHSNLSKLNEPRVLTYNKPKLSSQTRQQKLF